MSSVKPDDLLVVAEGLLEGSNEASLRAAVHCAYYAVFHECRIYLQPTERDPTRSMKHEDVEARLSGLTKPPKDCPETVKRARRHFRSLKRARVHADYKLDEPITAFEAERAVELAKLVIRGPT